MLCQTLRGCIHNRLEEDPGSWQQQKKQAFYEAVYQDLEVNHDFFAGLDAAESKHAIKGTHKESYKFRHFSQQPIVTARNNFVDIYYAVSDSQQFGPVMFLNTFWDVLSLVSNKRSKEFPLLLKLLLANIPQDLACEEGVSIATSRWPGSCKALDRRRNKDDDIQNIKRLKLDTDRLNAGAPDSSELGLDEDKNFLDPETLLEHERLTLKEEIHNTFQLSWHVHYSRDIDEYCGSGYGVWKSDLEAEFIMDTYWMMVVLGLVAFKEVQMEYEKEQWLTAEDTKHLDAKVNSP
ncbi:hypothetical protein DFH09DRAFT_1087711 [Mycena vulgaris]|nr:hypothetical protein DFH09DRAFT_1087711 [Mycena vulgaris]